MLQKAICGAAALVVTGLLLPPASPGATFRVSKKGPRLTKAFSTLHEINTRGLTMQKYDFTCGAAVLSTILTYYFGDPATEQEVIDALGKVGDLEKAVKRKGFSLLDMERFAKARGYEAESYRMDFEFLAKQRNPVIALVNIRDYDHFVLIEGVVGDRVVVADPAFGNYTMRVGRFLSTWMDGIGLIVKSKKARAPVLLPSIRPRLIRSDDLYHVVRTGTIYAVPALR